MDFTTCYFVLTQQGGFPSFTVAFTVNVRRQESNYPAEVIDALMLNFKESALTCNLDCFLNVCYDLGGTPYMGCRYAWRLRGWFFSLFAINRVSIVAILPQKIGYNFCILVLSIRTLSNVLHKLCLGKLSQL